MQILLHGMPIRTYKQKIYTYTCSTLQYEQVKLLQKSKTKLLAYNILFSSLFLLSRKWQIMHGLSQCNDNLTQTATCKLIITGFEVASHSQGVKPPQNNCNLCHCGIEHGIKYLQQSKELYYTKWRMCVQIPYLL